VELTNQAASPHPTWRLVAITVLVVATSSQPAFLLGAAFFQVGPEFGLGPVGQGALTAAFFLTAAATSTPLGRWVQRVGWQRAMRVNTRSSAVLMLLISLGARNLLLLIVLLVAAASLYGMSNPAANQALADHTDPARQATIFGMKHAGIPTSALLAGLLIPAVVVHWGWRWALGVVAVLTFLLSLTVPKSELPAVPHSPEAAANRRPLPMRSLLALALGSAFATWSAISLSTYLVTGALSVGFTAAGAGWLQFGGSAASIATRVGVGILTDRRGSSGLGALAGLVAAGAVVFALLPMTQGGLFALAVVAAFMTGWGWPGLMTFAVVQSDRAQAASSSAITQAGVFVGAGVGPPVLGTIIERSGYPASWYSVAAALAVAAVVVFRTGRR